MVAGYQTFMVDQAVAGWTVRQGFADLYVAQDAGVHEPPFHIQLHHDIQSTIEMHINTRKNAIYHLRLMMAGDWLWGDVKNRLSVSIDGVESTLSVYRFDESKVEASETWESHNLSFTAQSHETVIKLSSCPKIGIRTPLIGSFKVLERSEISEQIETRVK